MLEYFVYELYMEKFEIYGPTRLNGKVLISGAKNSALPILFASLLSKKTIELRNIPKLKDVNTAINLLNKFGSTIKYNDRIFINSKNINNFYAPCKLVRSMRASIWSLASLISRCGEAYISLPGGCNIGKRSIDLHIFGLEKLGAKLFIKNGYIKGRSNGRLRGAYVFLEKISVGATISVMIAATLAKGKTIIENAACEPEIIDTANFLNLLGAKIVGFGTNKIIIDGVKSLMGGKYSVIPDRIETGTFLVAAAASKGKITCFNTKPDILKSVLNKLKEAGANVKIGKDWVHLDMHGKRPNAVNINTEPYPGFPTDMQAQFSILNLVGNGISVITENIFENRFMHIPELLKMGAIAKVYKNSVICKGVKSLNGAKVIATDLRSSVSLVIAGCIAKGKTIINNIHHIDRGYENIENKFYNLCAKINRVF